MSITAPATRKRCPVYFEDDPDYRCALPENHRGKHNLLGDFLGVKEEAEELPTPVPVYMDLTSVEKERIRMIQDSFLDDPSMTFSKFAYRAIIQAWELRQECLRALQRKT